MIIELFSFKKMQITSRNNNIDIFRLIASYFIVILHMDYGSVNELFLGCYRFAGRWGVPFFFMISGYYFQRSLEKSPSISFKNNFSKILNIFIIANLVYLPLFLISGDNILQLKYIIKGNYFHLWFLSSLLIGLSFLYITFKLRIKSIFLIISCSLILLLAILSDSYSFIIKSYPDQYGSVRSILSIPFMTIGTLFFKSSNFKRYLKPKFGITLLILGYLLQIFEGYSIYTFFNRPIQDHQLVVGTIFYSAGIFILALTLKFNNDKLGKWGKEYSLFIYLYHPILIYILKEINYTSLFKNWLLILSPMIIFMATLFIGILFDKYFNRFFLILTGSFSQINKKKPEIIVPTR